MTQWEQREPIPGLPGRCSGILGMTRRMLQLTPWFELKGEAQLGQHWGMQDHPEVNALVKSLWGPLSWGDRLATTAGLGTGFSYAFERPEIEFRPERPPSRFLIYLLAEIGLAHLDAPDWGLFMRVHHRSDGFGVIGEARGSNFIGVGLRHRF